MPKLRNKTIRDLHVLLANAADAWDDRRQPESLRRYVLGYGAVHLRAVEDHARLWELLQSEKYRQGQLEAFQQYEAAYRALQEGIDLYVKRQGHAPEDDPRLCWLALRAGELGDEAKARVSAAFEWARNRPVDDPSRLDDALQRLQVLDVEAYYKALLLLLWIEAERQAELPQAEQTDRGVRLLTAALDDRLAGGGEGINWSRFVPPDFMTWLALSTSTMLPASAIETVASLLRHTSPLREFVEQLAQRLGSQPLPLPPRHIELVLALSHWLDAHTEKASINAELATLLIRSGRHDRARILLGEAQRLAARHDGGPSGAGTWMRIARPLRAIGERGAARAAFSSAIERLGREIQSTDEWRRNAVAIAAAMTREGEVDLALDAVATATTEPARRDILEAVLEALPPAEGIDGLDEIIRRLVTLGLAFSDRFAQQSILSATAAALVQMGRLDDALTVISAVTTSWGLLKVGGALVENGWGEPAARVFESALMSFGNEDALPGGSDIGYSRMIQLQQLLDKIRDAGDFPGRQRLLHAAKAEAEAIESQYWKARTLSYLARASADMEDPQLALAVGRQALDAARASNDPTQKTHAISWAAEALAYAGGLELALDTIATDLPHEARLSGILRIAHDVTRRAQPGTSGEFVDRALRWVGTSPDPVSRSLVLCAVARTVAISPQAADVYRMYEQAIALASSIDADDLKADTLAHVGCEIAQATQFAERSALLKSVLDQTRRVSDSTHRNRTLARLAGAFTETGEFERAIDLALHESDSSAKTAIVSSVLHAAISMRRSRPDNSREILRRLSDSSESLTDPSEQPFFLDSIAQMLQEIASESEIRRKHESDALVETLRRGNQGEAFRILVRSLAETSEHSEGYSRSWWLTELASVLIRSGDLEAALRIAEDPDLATWRSGIVAQMVRSTAGVGAAGDWIALLPRIVAIATGVRNYREEPHYGFRNDYRDQAFRAIVTALVGLERIDEALAIAQKIHIQVRTSALIEIARASLKVGSERAESIIDQAAVVASQIENPSVRARTLRDLAEVLLQAGYGARAGETLERALGAAESVTATWERGRALSDLASLALRSRSLPERSPLIWRALRASDGGEVPDELAEALAIAEDLPDRGDIALKLWRTLEARHDRSRNRWMPSSLSMRSIARVLLDLDRPEDLIAAVRSSENRTYRAHAMLAIAAVLWEAGQHQIADRTIQEARDIALGRPDGSDGIVDKGRFSHERSLFFRRLVDLLLEQGKLALAHSETQSIPDPAIRSDTLTSVAVHLAKAGRALDAHGALLQALASAEAIKDLHGRCRRLCKITDSVGELNDVSMRIDLLREVLGSSAAMANVEYRTEAHVAVAKSLARAGALTNVLEEFRQMLGLARSANSEKALELLHDAIDATPDMPGRDELLDDVFEAVDLTKGISTSTTTGLARALADSKDPARFSRYTQPMRLSEGHWAVLLHARRSCLVSESIPALGAIRETFRYCAFSLEVAYDAVRALHLAQLKVGRRDAFDGISRQCRQLGIWFQLQVENL